MRALDLSKGDGTGFWQAWPGQAVRLRCLAAALRLRRGGPPEESSGGWVGGEVNVLPNKWHTFRGVVRGVNVLPNKGQCFSLTNRQVLFNF